jgi:hypothetical protein
MIRMRVMIDWLMVMNMNVVISFHSTPSAIQ